MTEVVSTASTVSIPHESRYYTSSLYVLPADEAEKQRFEKQQKLVASVFSNNRVIPPVQLSNANILDIGTGSGAWSLDVLRTCPDAATAKFNCVDIESRLFPDPPPLNMTFQTMSVLNLSRAWSNKFSLVHQRLLLVGLKYEEWPMAIKEIHRVIAPAGWVQLCEVDPFVTSFDGPNSLKMLELVKALVEYTGLDFKCTQRIPSLLVDAGFINVNVDKRTLKLGNWGGELGRGLAENHINVWKGMKTPILRAGGFGIVQNEKEYDELVNQVQIEWETMPGAEVSWFAFTAQKTPL